MAGKHLESSAKNDEATQSIHHERDTSNTRKSIAYELFVLGELMDGPHHGYKLRDILSRILGPFRQISWGVLYPLIRLLEREEFIEQFEDVDGERSEESSTGRQRKLYRLTASGRKRFYDLTQEQGNYGPDYTEYFMIKLNNFDHLSHEQQLDILLHYQGYLQTMNFYLQSGQQYVNTSPDVPENQRPHILRTISFRASSVQAEINWTEREIANIESQLENSS